MLTTQKLHYYNSGYKHRETVQKKLKQVIQKIDNKLPFIPPERRYNYLVLKWLLKDILKYVIEKKRINTKTTYILPGALWIAKSLINNKLSIDKAAMYIDRIRYLTRRMLRVLVFERNLELIIPSNLSIKDVKIYAWTDKVGYDHEGNPLYILTMYFSFPFDINELDRRTEYEPVSFLFVKKNGRYIPVKAFSRVHYNLYVYNIEKMKNIKILFMRFGHTPKILASEVARITSANIPKEILDKLWLLIGDFVTRITGTRSIKMRDNGEKIHVYVKYKLPKTINNPFTSPIHPYFIDVSVGF